MPAYVSSAGDEAIDLAAKAALFLDEWQQDILRSSLGERPDGGWSAQQVGLVVGRQNGKGAILEARELWGLFLGGERLIIHTAHLQPTATQHFKRMKRLIRKSPSLLKRIDGWSPGMRGDPRGFVNGKGSEAIRLADGAEIFFNTRAGGGGRGLTANLVVFDEAMYLTDENIDSLVPTGAAMSMSGAMQLWYTGSAVDQTDSKMDGVPFARVRNAGIAKDHETAFFEWSLPYDDPEDVPDSAWADPESARKTNPSYNVRISAAWVESERTVKMSRRGYIRERLGVGSWPNPEGAAGLLPFELWQELGDATAAIESGHVFALAIEPGQTRAAIACAGGDTLILVEHRPGTDWIVEACQQIFEHRPNARFVIDPREDLGDLIRKLEEIVFLEKVGAPEYKDACGGFLQAVTHREIRHRVHPDLDEAVKCAGTKRLQDAWKWDWYSGAIAPLVAATLALWGARTQQPLEPMVAFR